MKGKAMFDHKAYQDKCKAMSDASLRYTIRDCQEALRAYPDSANAPRYADEICYCAAELYKRSKGRA